MLAAEQCPKALAWMAALCLASRNVRGAETWLIELIGVMVLKEHRALVSASNETDRARRDTANRS